MPWNYFVCGHIPTHDNEDSVCGILFNDEPYYFQKNLQGDIIAITDKNAEVVAAYSYDAWGVPTVISDTSECGIAAVNPFRYRGYYFDSDINLYYLQSRYYDPKVGRFINADDAMYLGLSGAPHDYDLYQYCADNPVDKYDPSGHYAGALYLSWTATSALSGALSGIMAGISASVASIKAAILTSWFIPVCIAATAIAIGGIIYVVNRVASLMYTASQTISAVRSKVNSGGINPNWLNNYTVYVIVRKYTVDVVYVGITKRYASRKWQHTGYGKRFPTSKFTMMPVATGLSWSQARAMEQTLITAYTLDTLKNMINSISPSKWGNFKTEFEQMQTLIQSWMDPE